MFKLVKNESSLFVDLNEKRRHRDSLVIYEPKSFVALTTVVRAIYMRKDVFREKLVRFKKQLKFVYL